MWHLFEDKTANGLWAKALQGLTSSETGETRDSRAGATRELLHAALTLEDPRARWVTRRLPPLNIAFALAEIIWILSGRNDSKFLTFFNRSLTRFTGSSAVQHGAYGARLRKSFGVDQLDRAYHTLKTSPDSRQVVLQIWDARMDLPLEDGLPRDPDIPCNTQSILKVRDRRLEWLQVMRSNDAFLGLPYNIIQFTFLQEVLAGWLGIEMGQYHHISDSLHLYLHDSPTMGISPSTSELRPDNFSLPRDESEIVITKLTQCIDLIIDPDSSFRRIELLPDQIQVPQAYQDMLRVLVAEGLRRRQQLRSAQEIMESCQSEVFNFMWRNWLTRFSSNNQYISQ